MNLRRPISPLKIPPGEYKRDDFVQLVRSHNELVSNVFNPGDLVATSLRFVGSIEVPYGQPPGYVYADANGFLKVIRESDTFAPSFSVRVHLGTVTTA